MRIVIDIDDTISTTINRDYPNAIPHQKVIEKINSLYDEGHEIVLYTARGQKSCNGNLEEIKKKNESILVDWLNKNNVKYHELLFGKPLADLYVDDKCLEVRDFVSSDFRSLSGGSGKKLYQYGRYVKKDLGTVDMKTMLQTWYNEKPEWLCAPHIISYLYNEVYMDYVEGKVFGDRETIVNYFDKLIETIFKFSTIKYDTFDLKYHLDKLEAHRLDSIIGYKINLCKKLLIQSEEILKTHASFSHGDMIFSNIIVKNDELYFIDPLANLNASSYLFDLAKIRMSLDNYECIFGLSGSYQFSDTKQKFDKILKDKELLEICRILEYMHIIRLYKYKSHEDRAKVILMLETLEKEGIFEKLIDS